MAEETEIKKKGNRGGRREGAGRKAKYANGKVYSISLGDEVAEILESQPNRSDFVAQLILQSAHPKHDIVNALHLVPATLVKPMQMYAFDQHLVAGFPIPLSNDERSHKQDLLGMLCPHPESCYFMPVSGDSMRDADILDGDLLVIDMSQRMPGPNDPAVCELNGDYTIKFVRRENDKLWLQPANPDFKRIELKEGDELSVWGIVTYVIRKHKEK